MREIKISKDKLRKSLQNIIDIIDINFDKGNNVVRIKAKTNLYILGFKISIVSNFVVESMCASVGKNGAYPIFVNFMSNNVFFERILQIIDKRFCKIHEIWLSCKQEKSKYGFRYHASIGRPKGLQYLFDKSKYFARIFGFLYKSELVSWKVEEKNIVFLVK